MSDHAPAIHPDWLAQGYLFDTCRICGRRCELRWRTGTAGYRQYWRHMPIGPGTIGWPKAVVGGVVQL